MFFVRYLDVCLVLATAPFVLAGGLPELGYLLGAGAWLLTRAGTTVAYERARRTGDPKVKAGVLVGAMMGRIWIVVLAIIVARFQGGKGDGIMAAALLLAAFTVYFLMSWVTRPRSPARRPGRQGRPTTS